MGKSFEDSTEFLGAKGSAKKVIGGTPAEEGRFDYAAALLFNGKPFCGGSIIAPRVVLTTAQCLNGIAPTSIRTRCVDISNPASCEEHFVAKSIKHPAFVSSIINSNDIGILILAEDSTAPPLRIAAQDFVLPNETPVTTIGWGWTDASGESGTSEILLEADLEVVDRDFCEAQYDRIVSVQYNDYFDSFEEAEVQVTSLDDTMFCTLGNEKDACLGDNGGSILLRCDETKEDVVVGTVSYGMGCAYEGIPALQAKTFTPQAFEFISTTVFEETGDTVTTVNSLEKFCLVGGTKAPTVAEEAPTPFPTFFEGNMQLWTCDPRSYAANDGCHCNCGIPDPDCQSPSATLFGCPSFTICKADGTCAGGSVNDGNNEASAFIILGLLTSCLVIACVCVGFGCLLWSAFNRINSTPAIVHHPTQQVQQMSL